jgi:hypothetical protein
MQLRHFDGGVLQAPRKTTSGTLYEARVASTAPMPYSTGPERRSTDELRRMITQLPGTPLVVNHPDGGMLASGATAQVVGSVQSARLERGEDGVDHAVATLHVSHQRGLDAINMGAKGLSLGYTTETTEPDADGVRWQTNCSLDHLALVSAPRCQTCSLRADHAGTCERTDDDSIDSWDPSGPANKGATMSQYRTDHNCSCRGACACDTDEQAAARRMRTDSVRQINTPSRVHTDRSPVSAPRTDVAPPRSNRFRDAVLDRFDGKETE